MKRAVLLVLGIFAFPLGAFAQVESVAVIPVVARTVGAGNPPTYWKSDVVIHNLNNADPVKVVLGYFPFDQTNTFPPPSWPVTLTLAPGETRLLEDLLGNTLHVTGNSKGWLFVSADRENLPDNPENNNILVISRTYNAGDPKGTYGQTIAPSLLMLNGSPTPSYAVGARYGGRYRSNLGVVNLSAQQIKVHFRVRRGNGQDARVGFLTVPPWSGVQKSFAELGVPQADEAYTVYLWLDPANVTPDPCAEGVDTTYFLAYVSKVDGNPQGTGDAEFIWAVPQEMPPAGFNCPQ